jgi:hypothetical protein
MTTVLLAASILLSAVLGVAESQAPGNTSSGTTTPVRADGLSQATAVIIQLKTEVAGIRSEYAWITEHYPGSKKLSQALTAWDDQHKRYDIITIETSDNRKVVLWFDITAMYE